jgi:hypothetical protein|tara:strand:+ start:467 stop:787 length:321 start_codon:yes stop_codon:yes gene_type:complete
MKKGEFCPLIQKKCVEHKCAWYTCVRGTNPNTGEEIDDWRCAVSWMPMMTVEIAQKSNQTGAAVESFRNEVVEANHQNQQLYAHALQQGINVAQITPLNPPMIGGE